MEYINSIEATILLIKTTPLFFPLFLFTLLIKNSDRDYLVMTLHSAFTIMSLLSSLIYQIISHLILLSDKSTQSTGHSLLFSPAEMHSTHPSDSSNSSFNRSLLTQLHSLLLSPHSLSSQYYDLKHISQSTLIRLEYENQFIESYYNYNNSMPHLYYTKWKGNSMNEFYMNYYKLLMIGYKKRK